MYIWCQDCGNELETVIEREVGECTECQIKNIGADEYFGIE